MISLQLTISSRTAGRRSKAARPNHLEKATLEQAILHKNKYSCVVIYRILNHFGSFNNDLLREAFSFIFNFCFLKPIVPKFLPGPFSSLVPSLLSFHPVVGWSCQEARCLPKPLCHSPQLARGEKTWQKPCGSSKAGRDPSPASVTGKAVLNWGN